MASIPKTQPLGWAFGQEISCCPSVKLVLLVLAKYTHENSACTIPRTCPLPIEQICKVAGITEPTAIKALYMLEELGLIVRQPGLGRQANTYALLMPGVLEEIEKRESEKELREKKAGTRKWNKFIFDDDDDDDPDDEDDDEEQEIEDEWDQEKQDLI